MASEDSWTRLFNRYLSDLSRVAKLFSAAKTPAELRNLSHDPKFLKLADAIASQMVMEGNSLSAKTWRQAAQKSGRGAMFYRELQKELTNTPVGNRMRQLVRENASLIKTLPITLARQATKKISELGQQGLRAQQVEKELRAWFPNIAASRLKLIARTELAKSLTALNQARSEELNLEIFQWSSSEDERVRKSHQNMDKVVCFWNDLPSPEALIGERNYGVYGPGGTFACRCTSLPVISLDELSYPVRVYRFGRIAKYTRAQLRNVAGHRLAA